MRGRSSSSPAARPAQPPVPHPEGQAFRPRAGPPSAACPRALGRLRSARSAPTGDDEGGRSCNRRPGAHWPASPSSCAWRCSGTSSRCSASSRRGSGIRQCRCPWPRGRGVRSPSGPGCAAAAPPRWLTKPRRSWSGTRSSSSCWCTRCRSYARAQFRLPFVALDIPLGDARGYALTWRFFGYSYGYEVFIAAGQLVGAGLLLHWRTTTLGACILVGVLANIAVVNFTHDLPVKLASTCYLLMAGSLVVPDLPRLSALFLENKPFGARRPPAGIGWPRSSGGLAALKLAFVTVAVVHAAAYVAVGDSRPTPISGAWTVDGAADQAGGPHGWRIVYFERVFGSTNPGSVRSGTSARCCASGMRSSPPSGVCGWSSRRGNGRTTSSGRTNWPRTALLAARDAGHGVGYPSARPQAVVSRMSGRQPHDFLRRCPCFSFGVSLRLSASTSARSRRGECLRSLRSDAGTC